MASPLKDVQQGRHYIKRLRKNPRLTLRWMSVREGTYNGHNPALVAQQEREYNIFMEYLERVQSAIEDNVQ